MFALYETGSIEFGKGVCQVSVPEAFALPSELSILSRYWSFLISQRAYRFNVFENARRTFFEEATIKAASPTNCLLIFLDQGLR